MFPETTHFSGCVVHSFFLNNPATTTIIFVLAIFAFLAAAKAIAQNSYSGEVVKIIGVGLVTVIVMGTAGFLDYQARTKTYEEATITVEKVVKGDTIIVTAKGKEYKLYNYTNVTVGDNLKLGRLANGEWTFD